MFWNAFLTLDNQRVHQLLVQAIWKLLRVVKQNLLDFHQGVGDFLCNVRDSLHRLYRLHRLHRLHMCNHNVMSHKCDPTVATMSIYDLCLDTHLRRVSLCKQPSPLSVCLESQVCNTSIGDLHLRCLPTGSVATPRVVTHFAAIRATRGHFFLALFVRLFGWFVFWFHIVRVNFFPIQFF